jgi:hypothetical protein
VCAIESFSLQEGKATVLHVAESWMLCPVELRPVLDTIVGGWHSVTVDLSTSD